MSSLSGSLVAWGAEAAGGAVPGFQLLPWPISVAPRPGGIVLGSGFRVEESGCADPRIREAVTRFQGRVSKATGMQLAEVQSLEHPRLTIECRSRGRDVPALSDDESYRLEVDGVDVKIRSAAPAGALRGLATLFQLVEAGPAGFSIPAVLIEDRPRFPWRGLLLDSSRHFLPVEVIKRNLDAMEVVKLNVLHWHLSDDQGFRVESRVFPKLHGAGSDGLFYTQEQVREVVEYARKRGIRVVPELDVPGHTTAWFVGHPELAAEAGPYGIERRWGIFDPAIDPSREGSYDFLGKLFGEMAGLFPDEYFHAGGDEVNGKAWDRSASVQRFRAERGLPDNASIQAYFSKRVNAILKASGKKMVAWDEVLGADLDKDVVVQSYRWHKKLVEAAGRGHRSILSSGYYLDLMFSAGWHYGVDPQGAEAETLSPEQKALILGGEACMWGEFATEENVDARIWPRAAAVAERLWSQQTVRDEDGMYRRLRAVSRRLEAAGSTHLMSAGRMLRRLAAGRAEPTVAALAALAEVVEPVKEYARLEARPYTSSTPLNRLVDIALPESGVAREFRREVDRYLKERDTDEPNDREALRGIAERLKTWRDNDALLQPLLAQNGILAEARPLSSGLASAAALGLEAIECLRSGRPPGDILTRGRPILEEAGRARAELILAVVPPIRRLVEAAGRVRAGPTGSVR